MLNRDDILRVASLAKLSLSEKEVELYKVQLSEVLNYINKLGEVNTGGIEPTYHSIQTVKNKFQSDVGMAESLSLAEVQKNAKRKSGRYIETEGVL